MMAAHSPTPDPRPALDAIAEADVAAAAQDPGPEKQFRGWRLLGVLFSVVVVTAIVSAVVDFAVIPR
jgi:hypothetical protein